MSKTQKKGNGKQQLISSYFTKVPQTQKPLQCDNETLYDSEVEFVERTPEIVKDTKKQKQNDHVKDKEDVFEEQQFETPKKKYKSPSKALRKMTPPFKLKTPEQKLKSPNKTPRKFKGKHTPDTKEYNVEMLESFVKTGISPKVTPNAKIEQCKSMEMITECASNSTTKADYSLIKGKTMLKFECEFDRSPLKEVTDELKQLENIKLNDQEVEKEGDLGEDNQYMFNDSWDNSLEIPEEEFIMDLNTCKFCKVLGIDVVASRGINLILQSIENKQKAKCLLKDFWTNSIVHVGCKVYIEAKFCDNEWIVSKDLGIFILEPDHLISCTAVARSLVCKRQAILQQYYSYDGGNKYMTLGILVHQLLQKVLKAKIKTLKGVESIAKRLLSSKETIQMLYTCSDDIGFINEQIDQYIPKIVAFIESYINKKQTQKIPKGNWKGAIDSIEDIEENVWCKELGLKGKIDVTVKSNNQIMPLELKTGRSTMSLEHRTQMLLYILMMNKVGYEVDTSLLLYLKDGIVKDFTFNANMTKDVLLIRNELAYYLTKKNDINESEDQPKLQEMPEPLSETRVCSRCDFNIVCAVYSKHENYNLSDSYRSMVSKMLNHLESAHIDYFVHWITLIGIESSQEINFKESKEIYTVPLSEREKNLQCVSRLRIANVVEESDVYWHTFVRDDADDVLIQSHINDGNYVVVSTNKRPAVATGIVQQKDRNSITVSLDRDLRGRHCDDNELDVLYHLDTYDSRNSEHFNMSNLALLLEPTDRAHKLRSLIIDKRRPEFLNDLPKSLINSCVKVLKELNRNQKRAVLKAMMTKDYLLIKGMPGTGKTATIVALIQCLIKLNKSVLITSHTHSSVDNVCVKLVNKGEKLLRLGSQKRMHDDLIAFSECELVKNCNTVDALDDLYKSAQVVAVTCLGAKHVALSKRSFDYCIIDESTQVLQPSILRGLCYADSFILIGDPDQLEPVVRNSSALKLGLGESMFERLCMPHSCVALTENYRMNRCLTACANALTYRGELTVANEAIGTSTLQLADGCAELETVYEKEPWIRFALDVDLDASVRIIDTGPVWNLNATNDSDDTRCTNVYENVVCCRLVDALVKGGLCSTKIGVISPYKAQVLKLSVSLKPYNVEVSTVDQFQGRDKHVIIYSCTRSNDSEKARSNIKYEILENKKRLTVALTRARVKFILISDLSTIKRYTPFALLLDGIDKRNIFELHDANSGFNWQSI